MTMTTDTQVTTPQPHWQSAEELGLPTMIIEGVLKPIFQSTNVYLMTAETNPELYRQIQAGAERTNVKKMPNIIIVKSNAINAGASGIHNSIVMSSALINSLPTERSATIIGHEQGHISRRHALKKLAGTAAGLFGIPIVASKTSENDELDNLAKRIVAYALLFGAAAVPSLRHLEHSADDFSAKFMGSHNIAAETLKHSKRMAYDQLSGQSGSAILPEELEIAEAIHITRPSFNKRIARQEEKARRQQEKARER